MAGRTDKEVKGNRVNHVHEAVDKIQVELLKPPIGDFRMPDFITDNWDD